MSRLANINSNTLNIVNVLQIRGSYTETEEVGTFVLYLIA